MSEEKRQKILLASLGTRGDMEPFIAIGEAMKKIGNEVVYVIPAQFTGLLPDSAKVYPLSKEFIELIESKEGKQVMGKSNWWTKLRALLFLYRRGREVNRILVREQSEAIAREAPDIIIHHPKCSYPVLWAMRENKPGILLSAVPYIVHPVKGHAHVGFPEKLGPFNRLTYFLANYGFATTVYDAQKHLPRNFSFSKSDIRKNIRAKKIMYAVSPALFPRPDYWPPQAEVVGFHEKENTIATEIDPALEAFLQKHPKPLLVTFGSMVNSEPERISEFIFQILSNLKIPTIVNTASGGLIKVPEYEAKEGFFFTSGVPYDYVMDRVYGVIHHGGSGTTHMALKYGCPTLIIPHIIDQHIWNRRVYELGAGPKGISINKLPSEKLIELIEDLYQNDAYKKQAQSISRDMEEDQSYDKLISFIRNENIAN